MTLCSTINCTPFVFRRFQPFRLLAFPCEKLHCLQEKLAFDDSMSVHYWENPTMSCLSLPLALESILDLEVSLIPANRTPVVGSGVLAPFRSPLNALPHSCSSSPNRSGGSEELDAIRLKSKEMVSRQKDCKMSVTRSGICSRVMAVDEEHKLSRYRPAAISSCCSDEK
jgi:hypothetical protein